MAMKKFYVGIKGFIRTEKGILLIQHAEGHWDIPGGRMDEDEDFEDTLRRELAEEVPGCELKSVGQLQGAFRLHRDIVDDISLVLIYFLVEADVPDTINFSEEHTKHLWVKTKDDIPTEVNPEMRKILENLTS